MLTILTGPARSGKTERLLTRYRAALAERPAGATLWLAPTWRAADEVRQRLFDGQFRGCFAPGVMTFERFAEGILHSAGMAMRPLTRLMKHELIRQIIAQQASRGRVKHFRSIAMTTGLVDLVCEFISELKRLEIWPDEFHRACSQRGLGDKDVELFEIYEAYQQALREHGLFDAEGRFWSARDVLARGEEGASVALSSLPSPLSSPQFVVVDGFSDFTRTQHEIIELLAARAETMIVTLLLEPDSQRTDLFAKPAKTLVELRRRHPATIEEQVARSASARWPAMARLEQRLFLNPRKQKAEAIEQGTNDVRAAEIEILAAARQVGEMELVAGRIKRLLVDGDARPGEIAVVFRSPQDDTSLAGEVFHRLGIPVVFESGTPLARSPALRALTALLQLDLDDWPFDQLLSVVGSNFFQPAWPKWQHGRAAADVERTIRALQTPHGRERLFEQLERASTNRSKKTDEPSRRRPAYELTLPLLKRLAAALDAMPAQATLPQWADVWRNLAQETGILSAIGAEKAAVGGGQSHFRSGENWDSPQLACAWGRLMEVLAAGDRLAAWQQQRPPELDRRAAFEALVDILASETIGHAGDESGCVRILSASSIRSLQIPYLFLAGLSEKVFPPPDRDNRLYSETEYGRMIEAGLPFVARTERTREEMLLFYEAITRAEKRLYLSYPALDEAAQPLLPSPFLREVEQALSPLRIPRVERADLRPIPADDEPLCAADFRVKALATALEGNVGLLAGLFSEEWRVKSGEGEQQTVGQAVPDTASSQSQPDLHLSTLHSPLSTLPLSTVALNLAAGLELVYLRQDRDRFGPAEGICTERQSHCYFASRFPAQHVFAATELEHYASCPFRFLVERILKIEPLDELALEFDVLRRGQAVHEVLATFHRRVNERLGRPGSGLELDESEFAVFLAAAVDESLPPETDNSLQAALREVDRRLVKQWLTDYRQQLDKYAGQWGDFDETMAAELFEVSFGRGDDPPSVAQPLEFERNGTVVRLSGRIDRIDTGLVADQAVFNILDYKSGGSIRLTPESIAAGTTLQLPIYAIATTELLLNDRDAIPWRAGYWYLRDGGFKPRQALRMYRNDDGRIELETAWEGIRDSLGDTIAVLVDSLRRGRFPVYNADERCAAYCPYKTVCRINQVRSLEKTWQPASE